MGEQNIIPAPASVEFEGGSNGNLLGNGSVLDLVVSWLTGDEAGELVALIGLSMGEQYIE